MKRSYPFSPRYLYEYALSEDHDSIVDPPGHFESTVLVPIDFKVNYMLRKKERKRRKTILSHHVDEKLDSVRRCFYMRLNKITGRADQEINRVEKFLSRFFKCHGVLKDNVIKRLIRDTKDFVDQKRAANSSNRVFPIAISINVYTLQQEHETIHDAKQRAITIDSLEVEHGDWLIKLLQWPPPCKFMIEFDHPRIGDCCSICLSKLSVGEEILLLSCEHSYHYKCLTCWVEKKKECPLCRCTIDLQGLLEDEESFCLQIENFVSWKRQMEWGTNSNRTGIHLINW